MIYSRAQAYAGDIASTGLYSFQVGFNVVFARRLGTFDSRRKVSLPRTSCWIVITGIRQVHGLHVLVQAFS